jgi:hypothetical protein
MKYSYSQLDALRFYSGDTRKRNSNGYLINSNDKSYLGDKNIYRTLNALLYPGINNEKERIMLERQKLNETVPEHIEHIVSLYCDLYTVMWKSRSTNNQLTTKRIERLEALEYFKSKHTISFTSTSKWGYDCDFAGKNGIILLEYCIPENTPYADFQKILHKKEYKYIEEEEVLLPPYMYFEISEGMLSNSDLKIKDINNKQPKGKYIIKILPNQNIRIDNTLVNNRGSLENILFNKDRCSQARNAISFMNNNKWNKDFSLYIEWKECLQNYLKLQFYKIQKKEENLGD